jgi:hypothetical protein
MAIKYPNIYHSKALQNLPKLGFLVWKNIPSGNAASKGESCVISENLKWIIFLQFSLHFSKLCCRGKHCRSTVVKAFKVKGSDPSDFL